MKVNVVLGKLRPVAQLGGVSYGRIVSTFERPRSKWHVEVPKSELLTKLDAQKSDTE